MTQLGGSHIVFAALYKPPGNNEEENQLGHHAEISSGWNCLRFPW